MFKTLVLAAVATLTLAQQYPKPIIPAEFTTEQISYLTSDGKLVPSGGWFTQKFSSSLNKISITSGEFDADGNQITNYAKITDINAKKKVQWENNKCSTYDD